MPFIIFWEHLGEDSPSSEVRAVSLLINFLHVDIETPSDIQFREVLRPLELCDQLWDEQQQVLVFHGHGVEHPVVLYEPKTTILLLNEEDWGSHQRLRRSDPTQLKVLLEKGIQFLLF